MPCWRSSGPGAVQRVVTCTSTGAKRIRTCKQYVVAHETAEIDGNGRKHSLHNHQVGLRWRIVDRLKPHVRLAVHGQHAAGAHNKVRVVQLVGRAVEVTEVYHGEPQPCSAHESLGLGQHDSAAAHANIQRLRAALWRKQRELAEQDEVGPRVSRL